MHKKKKKRKILIGRVYDLCIVLLYTIVSIITLFAMRNYTTKLLLALLLILFLILAIYILTFRYNKKSIEYIRKIFLTLLTIALLFVSTKLHSVNTFFNDLTSDEDQYVTTEIELVSLANNEYFTAVVTELDDIEGKVVGINTLQDTKAMTYVQDRLDGAYKNIQYVEYNDYNNMLHDLYYGYIDVACLNTALQSTLEANWGSLNDFTIHLTSYSYKEKLVINQNEKDITKEIFTVLISANDEVGIPANYSKSDANMLVIINPNTHNMTLVSIPRDSYIGNPAYDYASDKLTHTGNNGVENTREAVEEALGIEVDFYVKVSFSSVIEIIDTIGEIEVNVPIAFCEQDENRSFDQQDLICLNIGTQTLNGKEALAFARHRYSYENQDLGRNQAQAQVIKGVVKQLLTAEGISKVDDVLKIVPNYVITNFSNGQLKAFIKSQVDDLQPWSISTLSLANGLTLENIETASMPGVGTSVYYLNKQEVYALQNIVEAMKEKHALKEFTFSLNALYGDNATFKEGLNTVYYDPTLYE